MEEDETKHLRYSVWPSQKVEVPPVWAYPVRRVDEWFVYEPSETFVSHLCLREEKLGHSVQVPDELYLREVMALDLTDEDALFKFVEDYGPLGYEPEKSCLPYLIPDVIRDKLKMACTTIRNSTCSVSRSPPSRPTSGLLGTPSVSMRCRRRR